jgi:hypothetical protein
MCNINMFQSQNESKKKKGTSRYQADESVR